MEVMLMISPAMRPPRMAPGKEPTPPITTTTKVCTRIISPTSGAIETTGALMMPANPAAIAPMPNIFDLSTKCIAFSGRLLVIGFASGRIPTIQVNKILLKNISVVGLHWGAYRMYEPEKIPQAMAALFELYERGAVTPVVSSQYPLREAATALDEIVSRRSVGKVLLIP